jgi:hypothetical protein
MSSMTSLKSARGSSRASPLARARSIQALRISSARAREKLSRLDAAPPRRPASMPVESIFRPGLPRDGLLFYVRFFYQEPIILHIPQRPLDGRFRARREPQQTLLIASAGEGPEPQKGSTCRCARVRAAGCPASSQGRHEMTGLARCWHEPQLRYALLSTAARCAGPQEVERGARDDRADPRAGPERGRRASDGRSLQLRRDPLVGQAVGGENHQVLLSIAIEVSGDDPKGM